MRKPTVVFILAVAMLGGNGNAAVTGQWDFDHGDLRSTIGKALDYLDGASGATAGATAFNTTTGFGIPNIGGHVGRVMRFPRMSSAAMGYAVAHGAQPNGGGTNVNEYTVIMDILYPSASSGVFRSLFQTDNIGSGDFFVNRGNGIGISGDYAGNLTPDTWHRVAFAVNAGSAVPVVSEFVDGVKVAQQTLDLDLMAAGHCGPPFICSTMPMANHAWVT